METQLSSTWRSCSGIRFHRPCGWSGSHSVTPNLHVRGGACRGEEKAVIGGGGGGGGVHGALVIRLSSVVMKAAPRFPTMLSGDRRP